MTRFRRSSSALRLLIAAAALVLAPGLLSACEEDAATSVTGALAKASVPAVAAIELKDLGNGIASLTAKATDPAKGTLSFAWRTSAGRLLSSTGPAVQWRLPTTAGAATATVDVTSSGGAKVSAFRAVSVDAAGRAAAVGDVQIETSLAAAAGSSSAPGRTAAVTPSPLGPFFQPVVAPTGLPRVSTPIPAPEVALPTASPLPVPRPLATLPTPRPPAAEFGIPVPPTAVWRNYDAAKIPDRAVYVDLHFLDPDNGYLVGGSSVVKFQKTGPDDPVLLFRPPVPAAPGPLRRVRFVSVDKGFVAGDLGMVYRTTDAGQNWQDISVASSFPFKPFGYIRGLVATDEKVVTIGDARGGIFRTTNADAADPAAVAWQALPTRPTARPADHPTYFNAGQGFPTTPSLTWWVGDGVFKMDAANPDAAAAWTKLLSFDASDGDGASIEVVSPTELWVGTSRGNLLVTKDGGATWKRQIAERFLNREFNGNELGTASRFLPAYQPISTISALNSENVFLAGAVRVFDTRDAGATWRQQGREIFTALQMFPTTRNGEADFMGYAVGGFGRFSIYDTQRF